MSEYTDLVSAVAASVSSIAATFATAGVWFARNQLKHSREIAQLQFEDAMCKEYRDLACRLISKVLLGEDLSDQEYKNAFDKIFRYIDLSNEQICLRQRGRIGLEVWESWSAGIESNLALPAFSRAWDEIKEKSSSFQELRRFESEGRASDPRNWK